MLTLCLALIFFENPSLQPKIVFGVGDWALSSPLAFTETKQGSYLIVDGSDNKIYAWDEQGRPIRSFSRKGEGPGELSTRGAASIITIGEDIYVFDSFMYKCQVFNKDFSYKETLKSKWVITQAEPYKDNILAIQVDYNNQKQQIAILDTSLNLIQIVAEMDEQTFSRKGDKWARRFYPPSYIATSLKETIYWGDSVSSRLHTRPGDSKGLEVKLTPNPVSEEEINYIKNITKTQTYEYIIPESNYAIYTLSNYKNEYILAAQSSHDEEQTRLKGVLIAEDRTMTSFQATVPRLFAFSSLPSGILAIEQRKDELIPVLYKIVYAAQKTP